MKKKKQKTGLKKQIKKQSDKETKKEKIYICKRDHEDEEKINRRMKRKREAKGRNT